MRSKFLLFKFLLLLSVYTALSIADQPAAQAQISLGNFGIPTSSERFFETGTEKFEREIQQLQERNATEDVLQIHPDVQMPADLLRLEDPRIHSQNRSSSQVKLLKVSTQALWIVHPLNR
jgi:hypothetical protein